MNAIEMLKSEHREVSTMLAKLAETTNRGIKKRKDLLTRIASDLRSHTALEEEIFYPAFKEAGKRAGDDKLYFEALEEHRAAEELVLPDLEATDPASSSFSGRANVLKELIEHHVDEEESELFPRARELLGSDTLEQLGEQMETRKRELKGA